MRFWILVASLSKINNHGFQLVICALEYQHLSPAFGADYFGIMR